MKSGKLKELLVNHHSLSIAELAILSGEAQDDIAPIIREWVHRQRVEEVVEESFCGAGCHCGDRSSCATGDAVRYRWRKS